MSRPLRLHAPSLIHHVMARGNARMPIYLDTVDHLQFLHLLGTVVERYTLRLWAYCLMPNHYHLVVQPMADALSPAMRHLNGVYAQWWNRRHERVGHVTQGRFKAQVVQEDRHLVAVCRYVLLNPVRAGLCTDPASWRWSSCAATLGHVAPVAGFTPQLLLDACGGDSLAVQRAKVRALLRAEDGLDIATSVREDVRVIGDAAFVAAVGEDAAEAASPVPVRERRLARPPLDIIALACGDGPLQERVARARAGGYTAAEIARRLGLSRHAIRRLERRRRGAGGVVLPAEPAGAAQNET